MFLSEISYSEWAAIIATLIVLQGVVMSIWPPPTKQRRPTTWGKIGKWIYLSISIVLGIFVVAFAHLQENEQKGESQRSEKQFTNTISGLQSTVRNLSSVLATNQTIPPTTRLQILGNLHDQYVEQRESIKKEISQTKGFDINLIRRQRQNDRAIWENEQLAKDVTSKQQEEKSKIEEQSKQVEQLEAEKNAVGKCLPLFDDALNKIYGILSGIRDKTGLKMYSDFNGNPPTIYSSNLIQDGRFTDAKNSISLGTNDAWNFEFNIYANSDELLIRCQGGRSLVRITPDFSGTNYPMSGVTILHFSNNAWQSEIRTNVPYTNYSAVLESALNSLVQDEDEISPLPMEKENRPPSP
jgi:hypothetical protein